MPRCRVRSLVNCFPGYDTDVSLIITPAVVALSTCPVAAASLDGLPTRGSRLANLAAAGLLSTPPKVAMVKSMVDSGWPPVRTEGVMPLASHGWTPLWRFAARFGGGFAWHDRPLCPASPQRIQACMKAGRSAQELGPQGPALTSTHLPEVNP